MERSGYGFVMKSTMLRDDLGATAKALYAFLCVHADANGECFPSVKSICNYLQIQEDTCYKYLKQLKTAGVIEVTKKRQGTRFANNVYRLADRPYRKKTDMENEPYPEKTIWKPENPIPEITRHWKIPALGKGILTYPVLKKTILSTKPKQIYM